MSKINFSREIEVRDEVDVFVAGGGPSGVCAALSAARQGCSVFLAEGHTCFGGMGTAGLVPMMMGFSDGVNFLAGGIGREIYDRLCAAGSPPLHPARGDMTLCIHPEALKRTYDDMMLESGAKFALQTQLIAVEMESPSRAACAICSAKSGIFAVRARVFADCTGDGDLSALAGAGFKLGDERGVPMPGTLCSLWAEIDWSAAHDQDALKGEALQRAFEDGVFTRRDMHMPGISPSGRRMGGGNVGHAFGVDGTDERSVTKALIDGRRLVREYERFYKKYLRGFERMELASTGSLMGIRETRRIVGDYELSLDDFKARASFQDEIGRFSYTVDLHPSSTAPEVYARFEHEYYSMCYQPGESYGIPYRILTPKGLSNVLVAGRCVSADRHMQSSIRVMPGCFITGQAAGTAAALAACGSGDVRSISIAELQARLKLLGAFLPNAGELRRQGRGIPTPVGDRLPGGVLPPS